MEKGLGKILGVLGFLSATTSERVEWVPIDSAEFLKGFSALGGIFVAGGVDPGPGSGAEPIALYVLGGFV